LSEGESLWSTRLLEASIAVFGCASWSILNLFSLPTSEKITPAWEDDTARKGVFSRHRRMVSIDQGRACYPGWPLQQNPDTTVRFPSAFLFFCWTGRHWSLGGSHE
jgi:hypothetical protein